MHGVFFKTIIASYGGQEFHGLLHVLQFIRRWGVGLVFTQLAEHVGYKPEVAFKLGDGLIGEPGHLDDMDGIIIDVRFQFFGDVKAVFEMRCLRPALLVTEVQHQRHDWVALLRLVFLIIVDFLPVGSAVIADHAQWHILICG